MIGVHSRKLIYEQTSLPHLFMNLLHSLPWSCPHTELYSYATVQYTGSLHIIVFPCVTCVHVCVANECACVSFILKSTVSNTKTCNFQVCCPDLRSRHNHLTVFDLHEKLHFGLWAPRSNFASEYLKKCSKLGAYICIRSIARKAFLQTLWPFRNPLMLGFHFWIIFIRVSQGRQATVKAAFRQAVNVTAYPLHRITKCQGITVFIHIGRVQSDRNKQRNTIL